jgi:predicted kinase
LKTAILVNGVPASGKSTVAREVSQCLSAPLLTLDTVKESFFDHLGTGDRDYNRTLGKASYQAMFALIGDFPENAITVVDAWFGFQPLEILQHHIERARLSCIIEVWCHARPDVIGARYLARTAQRSGGHLGPDYVPELVALAGRAKPTGLFPLIDVDTEQADCRSGMIVQLKSIMAV